MAMCRTLTECVSEVSEVSEGEVVDVVSHKEKSTTGCCKGGGRRREEEGGDRSEAKEPQTGKKRVRNATLWLLLLVLGLPRRCLASVFPHEINVNHISPHVRLREGQAPRRHGSGE